MIHIPHIIYARFFFTFCIYAVPCIPEESSEAAAVGTSVSATTTGAEVYPCTWLECTRTFDRIKSRSAHLKWHNSNYKKEDGDNGEGGLVQTYH